MVGVRPDSEATAATLRTVFADYIHVEQPSDGDVFTLPNALSLRAPAAATPDQPRRQLSLLYRGGEVLARAATLGASVSALADVLAGLAVDSPVPATDAANPADAAGAGATTVVEVSFRLFVRGDCAVLANWSPPDFVNDRWLAERGIAEVPGWSVGIDLSTNEVIPAPRLGGLRWSAAGLETPLPHQARYRWVGLLTPLAARPAPEVIESLDDHDHDHDHDHVTKQDFWDEETTVSLLVSRVKAMRQEWLEALQSKLSAGQLRSATDSRAGRRAIADLLDG